MLSFIELIILRTSSANSFGLPISFVYSFAFILSKELVSAFWQSYFITSRMNKHCFILSLN